MATGGARSFSRTIDRSSEELVEHSCSRCEGLNQSTDASHYCPSCDKYLCDECLAIHEQFFSDADHNVIDANQALEFGRKPRDDECPDHPGHSLTMFCGAHEDLCCSVCTTVDHKLCETMTFLPNIAKGIRKSKALKSVKDSISKTKASTKHILSKKADLQNELDRSKKDFQDTMGTIRKKIRTTFDKLQEKASKEMNCLYDERCNAISEDTTRCQSVLEKLEFEEDYLNEDAESETLLFIRMKKVQKNLKEYKRAIENLPVENSAEKLVFTVDADLFKLLDNISSLGTFEDGQSEAHHKLPGARKPRRKTSVLKKQMTPRLSSRRMTQSQKVDIRQQDDEDECCVQGICKLENGHILLSDYNNKKLKQLDELYNIVQSCTLPSEPSGVCSVGEDDVAVALEDGVIQFVSVARGRLKKTRSIRTNHGCYGLAHNDGQLYVTEFGGKAVFVHDLAGELLQTISTNLNGEALFSRVYQLCVSEDGEKLYVTDSDKDLVTLRINWRWEASHASVSEAHGVCSDAEDNVYVCGNLSHNVVQFVESGKKALKVVVPRSEEIRAPECVYLDSEKGKLVVSSSFSGACDHLVIYDVV